MDQEQILLGPEDRRRKVLTPEELNHSQDGQAQKLEKLIKLLEQLGGNKFLGELLIKYESGQIVLVKKTQYIWLSARHEG